MTLAFVFNGCVIVFFVVVFRGYVIGVWNVWVSVSWKGRFIFLFFYIGSSEFGRFGSFFVEVVFAFGFSFI